MDQQHDEETNALTEVEIQLNANIRELMRARRWKQVHLAEALQRTQPWVSKRMAKNPEQGNKWKVEDLEDLQRVFQLSAYELLRPGHGRLDRRAPHKRRRIVDRRDTQNLEAPFGASVSPRLAAAVASSENVIEAANLIYELAERLHAYARQLLARHTADLSDTSTDGTLTGEALGREVGGSGSEKAG